MELLRDSKSATPGTRTRRELKKGCDERIAPRCTLSQNGYGTYYSFEVGWVPSCSVPSPTLRKSGHARIVGYRKSITRDSCMPVPTGGGDMPTLRNLGHVPTGGGDMAVCEFGHEFVRSGRPVKFGHGFAK